MSLPPSRKDVTGPPPRNVTDLVPLVRHGGSALRRLDPGGLGGRWITPSPVRGTVSDLTGDDGDTDGDGGADIFFIDTDQYVIDAAGDQIFALSYVPIDGSLHVRWVPLYLPSNNWTIADNILTVSDPGWRAGDLVEVAYAYEYDGEPEPSGIIVDFQSPGWKWLQVSTHDTNDYSQPSFDDSAWASASAAFGETTPAHSVAATFDPAVWPEYSTVWNQGTKMWARRTITSDPGQPVVINLRWNRIIHVYWNGAEVYSNSGSSGEATHEIAAAAVTGSDLLVIKTIDDGWAGYHTGCYFDAQIAQVFDD